MSIATLVDNAQVPLGTATNPLVTTGSGSSGVAQNTNVDSVVDGVVSTASVTSAVAIVTLNTAGYGSVEIQFTSVGSANTIAVESSNDGTPGTGSTFNAVVAWQTSGLTNTAATSFTPTTSGVWVAPVTGATMRVRVSGYTSGTVTAFVTLKRASAPAQQLPAVGGNVASAATDSGNPVKVGGRYNATPPTLTDGQRGDVQMDTRGNTRVALTASNNTGADGFGNGSLGFVVNAGSTTNMLLGMASYGFGGTNWDRFRSIQGDVGTGVGVTAVEPAGQLFSNITSATTTTVKSGTGILHRIIVNTLIGSATITVYNNTAGSGSKIATIALPSTITSDQPFELSYDLFFSTGLTIVTSGATDLTVTYR